MAEGGLHLSSIILGGITAYLEFPHLNTGWFNHSASGGAELLDIL